MWMRNWIIAVAVLFASAAMASDKTVIVATLSDYPPFCFSKNSETKQTRETIPPGEDSHILQGYTWDIFRESMHAMGYTIELNVVPWARTMHYLETGEVDAIFPTGKNTERLEYMNYSQEPINDVDFRVYVRADSALEWTGLDSLGGLTVAVVRGWNYGDEWQARSDVKSYELSAIPQGFSMLDAKRIDGFLGYEIVWDYTLRELGKAERYKKLPAFGSSAEYVTVLKANEDGQTILDAFDEGKRLIAESGRLQEIEARWR